MSCELFLIRHGQTVGNADGTHQVYQTPLSPLGCEQARRVADRLRDAQADALYSSDLERAVQTARYIAEATGLELRTDPRLREHDVGIFKGLTPEAAMRADADRYKRWLAHDCDARCPGGESPRDVIGRMGEVLGSIVSAHAGRRVLVVTHGRALRCAMMHLLGLPDSAYRRLATPNAAINIIRYAEDGPHLVAWGDTHHLDGLVTP